MEINTLNKRNTVVQSYSLNTAKYNLGAVAMDIVFILIAQIKIEDKDFLKYHINLTDLELKMGRKITRNEAYLDSLSDELLLNTIKIKNGTRVTKFAWCSSFEYDSNEGWINIMLDPHLKDYLIDLKKQFVQTDLKYLLNIKGSYTKRIYLLLKQNAFRGKVIFNVNELREMLDVPKSLRVKYSDFKKRVITNAIKEINKETDIIVNCKELKVGRSVKDLNFSIKTIVKKKELIETEVNKFGVNAAEEWLKKED